MAVALGIRPVGRLFAFFEPDAAGRSAVNAVALCNVALLAYSDWESIQRFLANILQTIANATREVQESIETLIQGDRFAHVGQLLLFLQDGALTSDELAWQEREVIYSGTLPDWLRNAPVLLHAELGEALRQQHRLLDHDPLRGYLPKLEAQLSAARLSAPRNRQGATTGLWLSSSRLSDKS
jgi:hypothetical protein